MVSFLVSLLVFVVIAAVILWLASAVVSAIPPLQPHGRILYGIIALILLIVFLSEIGWIGPAHGWRAR